MKFKVIKKSGALQEQQMAPDYPQMARKIAQEADFSISDQLYSNALASNVPIQQNIQTYDLDGLVLREEITMDNLPKSPSPSRNSNRMQVQHSLLPEREGFLSTVLSEGQRVLVLDKNGNGEIKIGPCRFSTWGKTLKYLERKIAFPGEFLVVKHLNGKQEHLPGPREEWLDPRIHSSIQVEDAIQIASKEAVIVYSEVSPEQPVKRRAIEGPVMFVPEPWEWLHTFSWHGSKDSSYRKFPNGLVFQKLWLMPDQMYHDIEEVRTSDDVVIGIKLMMFFELQDVEKMLDETHDPIGDFINAATSDVIDFVGRHSFESFKSNTDKLNELSQYKQLTSRASQVGYNMSKIVFRGYNTSQALQAMHEQSIETRTKLRLERETEEQSQSLEDFKQGRCFVRVQEAQIQDKKQEIYRLEKEKQLVEHEQTLKRVVQKNALEQKEAEHLQQIKVVREQQEVQLEFLKKIKEMNVDMTEYLTQGKSDKVIEFRGDNSHVSPHLHFAPLPEKSNS